MKFVHVHYDIIQPDWKVLQVGGLHQPFRRANVVIDPGPWAKRNKLNSWVQTIPEYFTKKTWVQHPLEETPWPFLDEEFDYVLVDDAIVTTRDPIAICREIERVGKRGYIEFPSATTQHVRNIDELGYTGYINHRWLVDEKDNCLRFTYKHPSIHIKKDFWITNPNISNYPWLNPKKAVEGYFWEKSLNCYEDYEAFDFPDWEFEENIWKYKQQTKTAEGLKYFWKLDEPMPVLLNTKPFQLDKLVSTTQLSCKFSIPMITDKNQRHSEMLKFEHIIAMKYRSEPSTLK